MVKQVKEKREVMKKHQYTRPFKDRDRTKDFGKGLPLKKSNRLKFPEKPQYYIIHTAKKLTKESPFFNRFNRDVKEAEQAYKEKILRQQQSQKMERNTSTPIQQQSNVMGRITNSNSLFPSSHSIHTSTPQYLCNSYETNSNAKQSSLGIVTISENSKSSESPFNRGFSVTSGPKVYKPYIQHILRDSQQFVTPFASEMASNKSVMSVQSLYYQQAYSEKGYSDRPSL